MRELLATFICHWYETAPDWGLNPGPTSPEASTLPLAYQGADICSCTNLMRHNDKHHSLVIQSSGPFDMDFNNPEVS